MTRRLPLLLLTLLLILAAPAGAHAAKPAKGKPAKKAKGPRVTVFEACHHGCRYREIQKAVNAAGTYAGKHRSARVKVAIRPGTYAEGIVVDGTRPGVDFDGLAIEGIAPDRKRTVLEGRRAGGLDGVEAIGVDGLVLANLWARNFESSGFLVHGSSEPGEGCNGYTMSNLLASGNRVHGLTAQGCFGGRMTDSAAYRQGDAGFSVGETPCDSRAWDIFDAGPCQAQPRPTLLRNDEARENTVGYAGPNAKYVLVTEGAFFNNGAGIVADSVPNLGLPPNGWNAIERNDVFWNNYNAYLAGSAVPASVAGLGELDGRTLDYPTGVGILLLGGDRNVVRGNHVFGNYKWGIATLSRPGEPPFLDRFDEAKSVDNEVIENFLGRGGADPNGEFDIWNDATGGNCWGANSQNATFAPGNAKVPPGQIYPVCPQAPVAYATAKSANLSAGLQSTPTHPEDPSTSLGYLSTDPPQEQQCSWVRRLGSHPPFQQFVPAELTPGPAELTCERR